MCTVHVEVWLFAFVRENRQCSLVVARNIGTSFSSVILSAKQAFISTNTLIVFPLPHLDSKPF